MPHQKCLKLHSRELVGLIGDSDIRHQKKSKQQLDTGQVKENIVNEVK